MPIQIQKHKETSLKMLQFRLQLQNSRYLQFIPYHKRANSIATARYCGAGSKKKESPQQSRGSNVFALKGLEQLLKTQLLDVKTYKRPTNGIFQRLPFIYCSHKQKTQYTIAQFKVFQDNWLKKPSWIPISSYYNIIKINQFLLLYSRN